MKERKRESASESVGEKIKHYFWKFLKISAAVGLGVVALKVAIHELSTFSSSL